MSEGKQVLNKKINNIHYNVDFTGMESQYIIVLRISRFCFVARFVFYISVWGMLITLISR